MTAHDKVVAEIEQPTLFDEELIIPDESDLSKLVFEAGRGEVNSYKALLQISRVTDYKNAQEHQVIVGAAFAVGALEHLYKSDLVAA
jgi:hypothetical protein